MFIDKKVDSYIQQTAQTQHQEVVRDHQWVGNHLCRQCPPLSTAPLYNPHSAFKFTTSITLPSRQRYRRGMSPPALLMSAFCAWRPLLSTLPLDGLAVCYTGAILFYFVSTPGDV